ncbi:(Fe-S)-binding protein [Desulfonema magnum]|uniref:Cysteine rich domain-containing protein n=1 Tax=Desulfonema magnum TaxID=45655 RepID=A0A975BNT4_9BACT|nr:(Fe-S)-binding protein [Desulfonema magnum]QTA88913.1 Cysteine rich domain-containing protein [Desulfonema magnum]
MKKFGAVTVFDLLIKYIKEGTIKLDKSRFDNVLATYHDPCNYGRKAETLFGHGYFDEPRWILDQCMDNWIDLYPTKKDQFCCGGGGGTLTTGYNTERILYGRKKMDQIKATRATMLVVPCHSCHGQMNNIKKEYGMEDLEVKYLWELVADCLIL